MHYIIVRNHDQSVLSRTSPDALLTWIDAGVSVGTDYRYAVTFETYAGAEKCAAMQGGIPVRREADRPICGRSTLPGVRRGLGPWVGGDCLYGVVC